MNTPCKKPKIWKNLLIFITALYVIAVTSDSRGDSPDKPSVSYRITEDESLGNIKRTVEVELQ